MQDSVTILGRTSINITEKTIMKNIMTKEKFIAYAKKYGLFNAIISLHLPYTFFSYDYLKKITSQKTPNFLERLALKENAECYLDFGGNYYPINNIEDVLKINESLGFLN